MSDAVKKPSFLKRFGFVLILLLVALIFIGVVGLNMFIDQQKAAYAKSAPEKSSLVTVMKVEGKEWTPAIEAVGYVRPNQGAMLSSQVSGTVNHILVKSGDIVKKGQLLVELDSSVEQASLRAMEAQLPSVQATYNRFQTLIASNSASKSELDNARSAYNQLVANIESLKASIKRRQIYAPFDGQAGIVKINVGQYINMGTEIVRVEDRSKMKVSFTLPQTDLERLSFGQKVTVSADALSGQTFDARISAIDPAVNKSTGLVELEATVDGRDKLYSGMFARLRIALPTEREQVVVPQIAVTYTMYGESAYVIEPLSAEEKAKFEQSKMYGDNVNKLARVKQVEVKTADRQGIYAQLISGVKVGDTIVTGGFQRLHNNALVEISDKAGVGTTQPSKNTRL
ncbi:efflux transporter periplasmic adaptor subunit [Vespertiliibacter pulmonis]|uniref:Membrane fusion protein (Multidrug efflux system) n=1 Tax=Vespertiliibacter pulmonis TaxID=1443036 RepID=A0A3N4WL40_9PAST|nr:efflux RND transporter periplasmic adaptor subunit [Vespertiliibacter pulmonis]QLB21439.1 efflux transporter periplasmic adaptor subunit [Vespertiliibacter pulmonis]RPE85854.1 membrane fusion protein (multidrug efflux system) [Vespertiliibacter pulmonis]